MDNKYIVFDFDGTIADSIDLITEIVTEIADEHQIKQFKPSNFAEFKKMKPQTMMKKLGVNRRQLTKLVLKVRKEMLNSSSKLKLIEGMKEVLVSLQSRGYQLGILTSNSKENVEAFVENQNMTEIFNFIYSGKNIFGKKKLINKMLRKEKITKNKIVYLGDETRDIEACKAANIPIIAVSWGFNSRELLYNAKPDFIADKPNELLSFIKDIF